MNPDCAASITKKSRRANALSLRRSESSNSAFVGDSVPLVCFSASELKRKSESEKTSEKMKERHSRSARVLSASSETNVLVLLPKNCLYLEFGVKGLVKSEVSTKSVFLKGFKAPSV